MDRARLNSSFASAVRVLSLCGMVVLVVAGILYFTGWNVRYDAETVLGSEEKSADEFWRALRGQEVSGYGWFVATLPATDSLCTLGIALLAATPLCTLLYVARQARGANLVFIAVLVVECLFIVFLPVL
jgi:hypothetical protein